MIKDRAGAGLTAPGSPSNPGGIVAEGVSLDGVSDYLSKASDFTGNADSKFLTFSCWIYNANSDNGCIYSVSDGVNLSSLGNIIVNQNGRVQVVFREPSTGNVVLNFLTQDRVVPRYTNVNLRFSIDMTNTSNRYVHIGDVNITSGITWTTYSNLFMNLSDSVHHIANRYLNDQPLKSRIFGAFLSREYIPDTLANRRIFINADGTANTNYYQDYLSAGYGSVTFSFPMRDASTAHINSGTGGDMVQNGTLATADRGANQFNCVASEFDGSGGRVLRLNSPTILPSNFITASFNLKSFTPSATNQRFFTFTKSGSDRVKFQITSNIFQIDIRDTSGGIIKQLNYFSFGTEQQDRLNSVFIMLDMTQSANNLILFNNIDVTSKFVGTDTSGTIDYSTIDDVWIGQGGLPSGFNSTSLDGELGEIYFDTSLQDPAIFWNEDTNKPKPLVQVLAETGLNPLIAHSMSADNLTTDLVGNSWTVNGNPTGARGATEFISRSMKGDGASGHLKATTALASDSKAFSLAVSFAPNAIANINSIITMFSGTSLRFKITFNSNTSGIDTGTIIAYNSAGSAIFFASVNTTNKLGWSTIFISCNLGTSEYSAFVNNIDETNTPSPFIDDSIGFSGANISYIGADENSGVPRNWFDGDMSSMYFTTDYIDFSDESNRNIFVNQLGYQRDLTPEIEAGNIPTPLIYTKFKDPDNLGKNEYGTDFSVVGNVVSGSDYQAT